MGLRFRKSFKVAPGVKVNVGKKSVGVSLGGKYGGMSFNTRSGARARVSAPGTGLSYSSKIGGSSRKKASSASSSSTNGYVVKRKTLASRKSYKISYIIFLILGIVCLIIGIPTIAFGGIIFIIFAVISFYIFSKYKNIYNTYDTFAQEFETTLPPTVTEGSIIYPEQNLKIIQDCMDIVNSTKSPDTFFERYNLMEQKIDELTAIHGPKYTGQSPIEMKAQVTTKKQAAIHDMITRYFDDATIKASTLKTEKGKANRFHAFISTLETYYDQMDSSNIKYTEELYNKSISDLNE